MEGNDVHRKEEARRGIKSWPRCALIEVMRAALGEQWPKPHEFLFIAIPRRGLETELTELLMLEALKEEADAGDEHAQQLLDHLVEESGAADASELIEAQRSRVEEMQQWQQQQLRLHAEAVARTEHRASQRKTIKAVPILAPAASGPASSKPKSTAAASSHQSEERKHASSSFASVSSSASASAVKANKSSDGHVIAASAELSPAQSIAAAELACSWTADAALTDVASLLQTGRRKFGVIVKAAVKFLHSLHPTSVNQSGSHRVFHFGQTGPVTLVLPHAGRRSKDGTVSQRYCTQLYKAMQQATMSQFGPLHSSGAAPQVQTQAQMQLPAAASSSTAVLAELD
jgi:predicted RNA binding protein YcfA (HicA-like mRNA interferase family)